MLVVSSHFVVTNSKWWYKAFLWSLPLAISRHRWQLTGTITSDGLYDPFDSQPRHFQGCAKTPCPTIRLISRFHMVPVALTDLRQKCQHGFCLWRPDTRAISARPLSNPDNSLLQGLSMLDWLGLKRHGLPEFFGSAVTTYDSLRKYCTAFDPCPCHYNKHQNCMHHGLLVLRLSYVGFCRVLSGRSSTVNVEWTRTCSEMQLVPGLESFRLRSCWWVNVPEYIDTIRCDSQRTHFDTYTGHGTVQDIDLSDHGVSSCFPHTRLTLLDKDRYSLPRCYEGYS